MGGVVGGTAGAARWAAAAAAVFALCATVATSCESGKCKGSKCSPNGGPGPAMSSCEAFCTALAARACALPIYDSAAECKQEECAPIASAFSNCFATIKAEYDCRTTQADICEDTGCLSQTLATFNCLSGKGSGTGGASAGTGGASAGTGGMGTSTGGATVATGGAGGAGSFTPAALGARLVVWLDAGKIAGTATGAAVATWSDQSPAHNDATQSTAGSRPVFKMSGINGRPSVTFDGSLTFFQLADAASLRWGTGDFAVAVVAKGNGNTGLNTMLYQKSDLPDPFAGPALFLNSSKPSASTKAVMQVEGYSYALSQANYADDAAHLFAGWVRATTNNQTVELRVDGARQGTLSVTPAINVDAVGQAVIIGHNGYSPTPGFQAFKGDIAEIVAVKGVVTDAEFASLEAYLKAKYALP